MTHDTRRTFGRGPRDPAPAFDLTGLNINADDAPGVDVEALSLTAEHAPKFWKGVLRADWRTAAMGVDTSLHQAERGYRGGQNMSLED